MIVLIAGMYRSGSTFSFNIARELLSSRGSVYQEPKGDLIGAATRAGNATHVILKCHTSDETTLALAKVGAARIIMTVRNIDDAMASAVHTFSELSDDIWIEYMKAWLALYRQLHTRSLILPYEMIDKHPRRSAWLIGKYIGVGVSPFEAWRLGSRYSKDKVKKKTDLLEKNSQSTSETDFSYYDSSTFFHRRHVSTIKSIPANQRIESKRLNYIKSKLASDIRISGPNLY